LLYFDFGFAPRAGVSLLLHSPFRSHILSIDHTHPTSSLLPLLQKHKAHHRPARRPSLIVFLTDYCESSQSPHHTLRRQVGDRPNIKRLLEIFGFATTAAWFIVRTHQRY